MGYFVVHSLFVIVPAFVLGLLVGWLWWGRRWERVNATESSALESARRDHARELERCRSEVRSLRAAAAEARGADVVPVQAAAPLPAVPVAAIASPVVEPVVEPVAPVAAPVVVAGGVPGRTAVPSPAGPVDAEQSDVEPSDVEPSDVDESDIDESDVDESDVDESDDLHSDATASDPEVDQLLAEAMASAEASHSAAQAAHSAVAAGDLPSDPAQPETVVDLRDPSPDGPAPQAEAHVQTELPTAFADLPDDGEAAATAEPDTDTTTGTDTHADTAAAAPAAAADDLKRIEGIGPKMEAALHAIGIRSFAALAEAGVEDLRAAISAHGLRFAPSLGTWGRQARLLADGDEAGFEALAAQLVGGRDLGEQR